MRLILFTLLFACTSIDRGPVSRSSLKKYLTAACLAGEGQGRVEVGSDDFSFDYGSIFEKNAWMLSVDVPMRGEEIMKIQKLGKGYLFEGSFYHQLAAGYSDLRRKNRFYKKEYLAKFLQFMGENLFLLKSFSKKKKNWAESYFDKRCGSAPVEKCTFRHSGREFQVTTNSLRVSKKLENFDLVWSFSDYSDSLKGYFENSELVLRKGNKTIMGVSFSHDSCQSETTLL